MKNKNFERKKIIKKLNHVLEEMPIDDFRDNSEVIIKHPYMRMVISALMDLTTPRTSCSPSRHGYW